MIYGILNVHFNSIVQLIRIHLISFLIKNSSICLFSFHFVTKKYLLINTTLLFVFDNNFFFEKQIFFLIFIQNFNQLFHLFFVFLVLNRNLLKQQVKSIVISFFNSNNKFLFSFCMHDFYVLNPSEEIKCTIKHKTVTFFKNC